MGEALEALAIAHAQVIDRGAGMAQGAIGKELRATLNDLAGMGVSGDSDFESAISEPS